MYAQELEAAAKGEDFFNDFKWVDAVRAAAHSSVDHGSSVAPTRQRHYALPKRLPKRTFSAGSWVAGPSPTCASPIAWILLLCEVVRLGCQRVH